MLPNSAFITVGEPVERVMQAKKKEAPNGEFAVLSGEYFSRVVAVCDRGGNPSSIVSRMKFALLAYHETRDCRNIYLGEEFPGIEYLMWQKVFRRPKRIVMLLHNVTSKSRWIPLRKLNLAKQVDHFLCLSPYSKQMLVTRYGIPENKVTVVYSRVDTDYFAPDPQAEARQQICSAGAINRDYRTLIDATRGINVDVKIAADTAWKYTVPSINSVADLPDNVEMRSWGNYSNLRRLYAESRIVVVPLLRPGYVSGITVALEAMAMGKAVILTRNPAVEGFIKDYETGFYVKPGDVKQLQETIVYLLENPDIADAVGQRARKAVLMRFTLEQYVQRIMSVWKSLD